jgi:hypothetical protein
MDPRGKSRKWIATNAYYFRIYFVKAFCLERGLFLGMTGFKHGPGGWLKRHIRWTSGEIEMPFIMVY